MGVSALGLIGWRRWFGGKPAAHEFETLTALADTLVPADAYPGAVQAGVPALLESRLARSGAKRQTYRAGFERLDELSVATHGSRFSRLPLSSRTEILERLAEGTGAQESSARFFFALARRDVLRAFYSTSEARNMLGYRPPREGYPDA
jgi:hypothetical protein